MKSLKWLLSSVLAEAGTRCDTDTQRDLVTMVARVENEGLSFLTISLPAFCTDFEKSLDKGLVDSSDFCGYKKSGVLPLLLGGLLSRVFDRGTGRLLTVPCIESILCVRQICLMWKKVNIACSERRAFNAIRAYVECDEEIGMLHDYSVLTDDTWSKTGRIRALGGILWSELGAKFLEKNRANQILPKHGPGATAERIRGNSKYSLRTWHTRLQTYFPYDQYALPSAEWLGTKAEDSLDLLEPGAETPVRVVLVPKTLKTPRVIAIEPVCMQYTQQAVAEFIVNELERSSLTRGHVNFRDQGVNQDLALTASRHGSYATLDLKDASDRVSLPLVKTILHSIPDLLQACLDCRSTTARLPDGTLRSIKKFASMGSALCFPIEAICFYTVAILGRLNAHSLAVTPLNVSKMSRGVYVYGDDIIVPVDEVATVISTFELFGLKVNLAKSFWTGKFRESCGMDAYDGKRVTPVYLRELPGNGRSKQGLVSLVSFANQLYLSGWWATAREVRARVESLVGPLPHVLETSPGLGWISYLGSYSIERWDDKQMAYKVRTYALKPVVRSDPLEGHGALLKFFLSRGKSMRGDDFHKSGRPGDVHVNRRWVRPY